ncbi:MAG: tRNA (adenosine(37)-N6)-threonylcarbamoyltransferase complex dimerization subunit type 1 TsaB [Planctomycetaceae bacterium]
MWTVGIETSARDGSVALLRDEETIAERSLSQEGRRHARTLVHELHSMLKEAGIAPRDCDLIAVSQGPGSFTGLRVGVVCAKTWAYATGCQLVGVDTLLAIASSAALETGSVHVVADAQRGDLFHGVYQIAESGEMKATSDVRVVSADDWISELTAGSVVAGPAMGQLKERLPTGIEILPASTWFPTAVSVAKAGRNLASAKPTADPWMLNPIYLRKSAAEEKAGLTNQ